MPSCPTTLNSTAQVLTNSTTEMVASQCLHILHFKCLHKQIFKSQQCQRILNLESQNKSSNEVGCFLKTRVVCIVAVLTFGLSNLNLFCFDIVTNLKLQLLNDRTEDLQPVLFQWRDPKTNNNYEFNKINWNICNLTCSLALQSSARSSAFASCDLHCVSTMRFAYDLVLELISSRHPFCERFISI